MEKLPEDLIANILSRLGVKNLLQLKCVSKLWEAMIAHPTFAKLQMDQNNGNNRKLIVLSKFRYPLSLDFEEDESSSSSAFIDNFTVTHFNFPLGIDNQLIILGSCNGLLCVEFGLGSDVVIWNPFIRKYRKLTLDRDWPWPITCGFGYDSVSDDYKVVMVFREAGEVKMKVFSLKTNTWRSIEECCYGLCHQSRNFLHGSLHWLACRTSGIPQNTSLDGLVFVAFSLAEEKFVEEVPEPDVGGGVKFKDMTVLDGCLCLCRVDSVYSGVEMWVMKEYMVRDSWTKLCTVLWETIPDFHQFLRPLCYSKSGDVLLEIDGNSVVKYNMQERICTTTAFSLMSYYNDKYYLEAIGFVQSLVSPIV